MSRCFIFAAGTFYGLRERPADGDLVIAADAGYRACQAAGIVPAVVLGDFDSMDAPEDGAELCRLPVEKDDTDTLAAVRLGLERGCTEFHIYGGTGGKRLDHTVANFQTLLFLRRQGGRGFLYDNDFVWTVLENESITVKKTVEWGLLSVFSLGDRAEGVTETGVQYPLTDGALANGFPMGVSNHILAAEAAVSVRHGALLLGWELPAAGE
ncbi:MAG: thiamine diphosphokinase [Dysosmobacter sp.]|nr:thiamine diphosphokinase [Dysosmobacter sp.]